MTRGRVSANVYRSPLRHLDLYRISYHYTLHIYSLALVCNRITILYICQQASAYVPLQNDELRKCYRLGRVACQAVVEPALECALCVGRVEVHLFLYVSSVSADPLRCHFGKKGSRTFGFDEALLGVFVSYPSAFCAQQTQHPACSLLRPRRVVS